MRISTQNFSLFMLSAYHQNMYSIGHLNQQLSSGNRIISPSDDPTGNGILLHMNSQQEQLSQYQTNNKFLADMLSEQEVHVKSINDQFVSVQDQLLQVANEGSSTGDLSGFGEKISSLMDTMLSDLNAKNAEGKYYFGGTANTKQPYVIDDKGHFVYAGNHDSSKVDVGEGVTVNNNVDLSKVFSSDGTNVLDLLNKLKELSDNMKNPAIPYDQYKSEVKEVLSKVQQAITENSQVLGQLGSRQNELETLQNLHDNISLNNQQTFDDVNGVDVAKSYSDLQLYMASTKAALSTYNKVASLPTLFDLM